MPVDQSQLLNNANAGFGQNAFVRYRGQGFKPTLSQLTGIAFDLGAIGTYGIKVYIDAADSNSIPLHAPGSELYSFVIPNASLSLGLTVYNLPAALNVTPGSQYCFYLAPWDPVGNAYIDDYRDTRWQSSDVYANGKAIRNDNGTWSNEAAGAFDMEFETVGQNAAVAPTVSTDNVENITSNAAQGDGTVSSDGGATITQRGLVYATHSNPTTSDTVLAVAGTTGSFNGILNGLTPNTAYHVRAFATNSAGTSYGADYPFMTKTQTPQVTTKAITGLSYTPKSKYAFLLYVNGVFFADLSGIVDNRKVIITRNDFDQISFQVPIDKMIALCATLNTNISNLFQSAITEVRVKRYNNIIAAGELSPWNGNLGGDRNIQCVAYGWFYLFKMRRVTQTFTSQSALAIAQNLINTTLAKTYGSSGNYNGLSLHNIPSPDLTTVYASMQYDDSTIYDALKNFADEGNFDLQITWDKKINFYTPTIGVVRSDLVFSYPNGNLKDLQYSVDPTNIVNSLLVKGKGSGADQVSIPLSDPTTGNMYGLREDRVDFSNVNDTTQLTNLGNVHLSVYKNPVVINQILFDGSGKRGAPTVGSFGIGDQVRIIVNNFALFEDINKYYTIDQIEIDIDQDDSETVTLSVSDPTIP